MREIIDFIMIVAFVLFMIVMVRGFMLQSQEKNRGRKEQESKK
jgi:large-conductance mechanosensitive channel